MATSKMTNNHDVSTILLKDKKGSDLLCFLEQVIEIEEAEYALLTPVDTPVSLFLLDDEKDPELIEKVEKNEQILEVADVVLQEHELNLVRSAVTLTVSGELDEPEIEELEDDYYDEESETYELLVTFKVKGNEYGLYIPLDPFFIVGKNINGVMTLVEDKEFDRIQEKIEKALEERDPSE